MTAERFELPLHLIETAGGGRLLVTRLTADCPRQSRVVSVDECVVCPRCAGLSVADGGDAPVVLCEPGEGAAARRPRDLTTGATVADAMSRNVLCVREDLPLAECRRQLLERGITGAPVVDGSERPIGIISRSDLLARVELLDFGVVRDLMSPLAFTLTEAASLTQAAALMAYEGVHRLPIVSPAGRVVGILSAMDVAAWLARHAGYVVPEREH